MGTGRLFAKRSAYARQPIQCRDRVAEHGPTIQSSLRLVQRPQRFRQIAIQFKELLQEPLWNFIWGKIHAVQSAEEREEVEPGNFQARTEVAGNGPRVARSHARASRMAAWRARFLLGWRARGSWLGH